MRKYFAPQAEITRLRAVNITTVSTEADWKEDEWDEALAEEDDAE